MRLGAYRGDADARAAGSPRSTARPRSPSATATATRSTSPTRTGSSSAGCASPACRRTACCPRSSSTPDHPWFIGVQFHPELKSRAVRAAPAVRLLHRGGGGAEPAGVAGVPLRCALAPHGEVRHGRSILHPVDQPVAAWSSAMNDIASPRRHVEHRRGTFGNELPLALIAGPCALESRAHALEMAAALKEIAAQARHRPRLQDLVRQGEPHQRARARAASASRRRCRSSPRSARRSACRC